MNIAFIRKDLCKTPSIRKISYTPQATLSCITLTSLTTMNFDLCEMKLWEGECLFSQTPGKHMYFLEDYIGTRNLFVG